MKHYNKFLIGVADEFNQVNYPSVNNEISLINEKVGAFPVYFKTEIIISFLKDHSLQSDWIHANPQLTELVTSGTLFTGNIESLFDSCRNNPVFRHDLEAYLKGRFAGHIPA